jgi:hypothetical protein
MSGRVVNRFVVFLAAIILHVEHRIDRVKFTRAVSGMGRRGERADQGN